MHGLVNFAVRRKLVSARVPAHSKSGIQDNGVIQLAAPSVQKATSRFSVPDFPYARI